MELQGRGDTRFLRVLLEYLRVNVPEVVVIVEPRISGDRADRVARGFPEFSKIKVDAQGFSGGIWVWWQTSNVSVTRVRLHPQAIHFMAEPNGGKRMWITAVYGHPSG